MPIFTYKAIDGTGVEQTNTIEAEDAREAVNVLRGQSVFVLEIVEGDRTLNDDSKIAGFLRYLSPFQYLPVNTGDVILFFRQMSLMLRAGHTVVGALDANENMVKKLRLSSAIRRMGESIRRGKSFSAVMIKEKKIFDPMISKLIASGEKSGNLDSILDRLAKSLEGSRELKRQLVAAMIYPSVVLMGSVGVTIFLVVGVIPRFATFLTARNVSLPASTQMLLDISGWFLTWGREISITTGVVVFSVFAAYTTKVGKKQIDRIILYIPLVGKSITFAAMAQAGWNIAMLLRSGVTALQSLRIVSGVINNRIISDCFESAAADLLEGKNVSGAFKKRHIPQMMRHMAAIGESSGELDSVMFEVGEYYQKELSAMVKVMAVMIEPMLIVGVGVMVGFVYYAFFQAVMSVSTGGM